MINTKEIYNTLLNDSRITELVSDENIFNAWPDEFETFPCIVFMDENQSDDQARFIPPAGDTDPDSGGGTGNDHTGTYTPPAGDTDPNP